MKRPIFVTDSEYRHALNIIRSVGTLGNVTAQGTTPFATGFFSRYTKKRKAPLEKLSLKKFDVVFLVTDRAVELGIKKKARNALIPSKKQFEMFRDKEKTVQLAEEIGVPVPETTIIRAYEDEFKYPVYVKPAISSGSRGATTLANKKEAEQKIPPLLEKFGTLLIQEKIKKESTIGTEI